MAHWPVVDGRVSVAEMDVVPATPGATNTKGAWSQLLASTPFDVLAMSCRTRIGAGGADTLTDVGIGAAASEVVVIPNLFFSDLPAANSDYTDAMFCPVYIPKGTRLAVRQAQSALNSQVFTLQLLGGGLRSARLASKITDIGTDAANSRGTAVSIPASGTGAYAQLIASTAQAYRWLGVSVGEAAVLTAVEFYIDIGIGAAASEQVVFTTQRLLIGSANVGAGCAHSGMFPCLIPSATRVAARAVFLGGTGTQTCYVSCHGGI